jgi:hypothetical protein
MRLVLLAGDEVFVTVEMPVQSIEHVAPPEVRHRIAALRFVSCATSPDACGYLLFSALQFWYFRGIKSLAPGEVILAKPTTPELAGAKARLAAAAMKPMMGAERRMLILLWNEAAAS